MSLKCLRQLNLASGARLEFIDRTNRYFGDYHRVLIDVELILEPEGSKPRIRYQKPLKRMGVASEDVGPEQETLIERFLQTAQPYMERPEYLVALRAMLDAPGQKVWKQLKSEQD